MKAITHTTPENYFASVPAGNAQFFNGDLFYCPDEFQICTLTLSAVTNARDIFYYLIEPAKGMLRSKSLFGPDKLLQQTKSAFNEYLPTETFTTPTRNFKPAKLPYEKEMKNINFEETGRFIR